MVTRLEKVLKTPRLLHAALYVKVGSVRMELLAKNAAFP